MRFTISEKLRTPARYIAIALFICGFIFNLTEIAYQIKFNEINAFNVTSFIFHVGFFVLLSIGLFFKKDKVTEIGVSVLKVFDGVFYPLLAMEKADKANWSNNFVAASTVTFIIASVILLIVLIFYILEKITNKAIYYKLILLFLFLSFIAILVAFFCSWVESANLDKHWSTTLETGYLCFLFLGMYFACLSIKYEEE